MKKFILLLCTAITAVIANAQTPVPMASQPGYSYTETFTDIANWTANFASGTGASAFASVPVSATGTIPSATRTTVSSATFSTGSSGGVQKGTSSIVMLSTGSTDNTNSVAFDFLMNFTGVNAGTLSFDWASVNNSTGDRKSSLRVYYSTDNTNWTELSSAAVLNFTNNSLTSGSISVSLPAAFNNSPTARLRFYEYNGSGGTTGSRPKISIDNLTVTASPGSANVSIVAGADANEAGSSAGTFTLTFSAATTGSTTVNLSAAGTATTADYSISSSVGSYSAGVLTVPLGTSSVTININPVNDALVEGTETVDLTITSVSTGYVVGVPASASINILDDDLPTNATVALTTNGAEPSTSVVFTVTLSAPAPTGGVTVSYIPGGTATNGVDYSNGGTNTVFIADGNTTGQIVWTIIDDNIVEGTETVTVQLTSATNGVVLGSPASASGNIADDDTAPLSIVSTYNQNFDALANTGTSNTWTNNSTIAGWYASRNIYLANDGASNSGGLYSYGTVATTDRALGSLESGSTGTIYYGIRFMNASGTAITKLKVRYTGEQWRNGGSGSVNTLSFSYQIGSSITSLTAGSWTPVTDLAFASPITTTTAGALNGNLAANSELIEFDISGLNIAPGQEFFLRFDNPDNTGSDHGLAIDNFYVEINPVDLAAPVVTALSPAAGAVNVPVNIAASLTFNEAVQKGTGNLLVKRSSDNAVIATITQNDITLTSPTVASFNLSGLPVNTGLYIEVPAGAFKDLANNNFAGIAAGNWSFTTGTTFYAAAFNNCTTALTDGFTQYSQVGEVVWACTTFGRDPNAPAGTTAYPYGVQINGFANGSNTPNVDWLISPSFNLTNTTYPLLSFWSRTAFNGLPLQLKVSTNYTGGDPNLATWTDINGRFPAQTSNVWTLSSNINLAAFKAPNVHFAFVYTSTVDDGARWTIDDVSLDNSPNPPPPTLTVSSAELHLGFVAAGSAVGKSMSFTGNDLTGGVTLTVAGNFQISKDSVSFGTTLNYTLAEANNITKKFYVKFTPNLAGQDYTGSVTIASSGLDTLVQLDGTSIDPATTLEVVNWNVEWFGSPVNGPTNDNTQQANVGKIMQNVGADIFGLLEVVDESRLAQVVASMPGYSYKISNFGSHTNTSEVGASPLSEAQKLAFVYKTSLFSNIQTYPLLSQGINSAADVNNNPAYNYFSSGRFPFVFDADVTLNCVTRNVKFVLLHAKANTSPTAASYDRRKRGADTLAYTLNTLFPNDNVVLLGDYNDDLDQSITAGFTVTSYSAFVNDPGHYNPVTLALSLAGKKSTVAYNDMIDHVTLSNEMSAYYLNNSATVLSDVSTLVTNYGSTTTDHYPILSRYSLGLPPAPSITNCPVFAPVCASTGTYQVPVFAVSNSCGQFNISYQVSGATTRSGQGSNASGSFNPGTSQIVWTATDLYGRSATCTTTVVIYPKPLVTVADAYAMTGLAPNTVYLGYTPASSITYTATATGGSTPYSYSWGAQSGAQLTVSPTMTTTYTATVTDANGCQNTASKTVTVVDIRSGIPGKVYVCHGGKSLDISSNAVAAHLGHGDALGSCGPLLNVGVVPNPTTNSFNLQLSDLDGKGPISIRVVNASGVLVQQLTVGAGSKTLELGAGYASGMYYIEVERNGQKASTTVLKTN